MGFSSLKTTVVGGTMDVDEHCGFPIFSGPEWFRILLTGSRDWTDPRPVVLGLKNAARRAEGRKIVLVHGACRKGVDLIGNKWGLSCGLRVESHRAENFGPWPWCGPIRNRHMVSFSADLALAVIGPCTSSRCQIPDVHPSHGASGCADLAEEAKIPTYRYYHPKLR